MASAIITRFCVSIHPQGTVLLSIIQAAGWPIWPLILCSVLALALIIERLLYLRPDKVVPPQTLAQALEATRKGLPNAKFSEQLDTMGTLGPVLASGLRCLQHNPQATEDEIKTSMEMAGRLAARQLERYMTALGTIASAAPLLGLLGTVIGMIEIFSAHTAGDSQPAQLAYGISVALYNTAFGLIVAIPALMFWRYFRALIDNTLLTMEVASEQFARQLSQLRR
jgi:biopolymer transport protein ExbB